MRGAQGVEQRRLKRSFLVAEKLQARFDLRAAVERRQALGDDPGDHCRRQLAEVWQQRTALLIELADHDRTTIHRPVIKLAGQLVFDDAAFFLDHQNLVQTLGKVMHRHGFKWPTHADLEHTNADLVAQLLINTQLFQRLTHVQVGLAGGDDTQPRLRGIDNHFIELIGAGERSCGVNLVRIEPRFLGQRWVRPTDVQAAFRQHKVFRDVRLDAQRIDFDNSRRIDVFGDGFHRHPAPAVARQLPADDAVIENFLNVARVEHRDHRRDECVFALVGDGRGFAAVVIARKNQHTALGRDPRRVAVFEHITAAIHPRTFAVPQRKHAVVLTVGKEIDLLAAPDGRGRKFFVDTRLEMDGVLLQVVFGIPKAFVQIAQRRAAIAGNEARRVQALRFIALLLQHRQAGQCLSAGQVEIAGGKPVFIIQTNISQGHARTSLVLVLFLLGVGLSHRDGPARQPWH